MTRRDYVLLSDALSRTMRAANGIEQPGVRFAAREIAYALAERNRQFDQPRFLRDSGVM